MTRDMLSGLSAVDQMVWTQAFVHVMARYHEDNGSRQFVETVRTRAMAVADLTLDDFRRAFGFPPFLKSAGDRRRKTKKKRRPV